LVDIYDCELEVMYSYPYYGETVKGDLYIGDITGILELLIQIFYVLVGSV